MAVVTATIPPPTSAGHLPGQGDCTVTSGESIQAALDNAEPYTKVTICRATYHQDITINTDGIQLVGIDNPVLDGSLLTGERHAITLAAGLRDITIQGFTVRDYGDPLNPESQRNAIITQGDTYNITIQDNHLHDNAVAGIQALDGRHVAWTIANNTMDDHGFTHLLLQDVHSLLLTENHLTDTTTQGALLAGIRYALIANNTIDGSGEGAFTLTPHLFTLAPNDHFIIENNTITGDWWHGLWGAELQHTTLDGNDINTTGTDLTLAAIPTHTTLLDNELSTSKETPDTQPILDALSNHATEAEEEPGFNLTLVEDLLTDLLGNILNPDANPEDQDDIDRLTSCHGQNDACLRDAFLHPDDSRAPHAWSTAVDATLLPGDDARLEFIDVATRDATQNLSFHHQRATLDQDWTTLVICRLYIDDVPHPCRSSPRLFDYSLGIHWEESPLPQHASTWRLTLPTDEALETFDRLHGPDATLFKKSTKPHHQASEITVPTDPHRTHQGGTAQLQCAINTDPGLDPSDPLPTESCPQHLLLTESLEPGVHWCTDPRPAHADTVHQDLTHESLALWSWAGTCQPATQPIPVEWTNLLSPNDRTDLADAQETYYNTTDPAAQETALREAELTLERAAARHIALSLPNHGMPRASDEATLSNASLTNLGKLPKIAQDTTAVWTGQEALVLWTGGSFQSPTPAVQYMDPGDRNPVVAYNPATGTARTTNATLPYLYCCSSSVWTGEAAYLFGGASDATLLSIDILGLDKAEVGTDEVDPSRVIHVYEPTTETLTALGVLPIPMEESAAVWDPRSLPQSGCAQGCAYLFTQDPAIYRFDPTTATVQAIVDLDQAPGQGAAVWTGQEARFFDAENGEIITFDPLVGTPTVQTITFPTSDPIATATWDGTRAHLFPTGPSQIWHHDPLLGTIEESPVTRSWKIDRTSSAWDGTQTLLFGGLGDHERSIHAYTPPENPSEIATQLADTAGDHDVVDLQATPPATTNLRLLDIQLPDVEQAWVNATEPGLVAFTQARATFELRYDALNGDALRIPVELDLLDRQANLTAPPLLLEFAGQRSVSASAYDLDNLDYRAAYLDPTERRAHSLPLLELSTKGETQEASADPDPLSGGVFDTGGDLIEDVTEITTCVTELATGQASGTEANLDDIERLAASTATACTPWLNLTPILHLALRVPVSISLVIQEGDELNVSMDTVFNPTKHLVTQEGTDNITTIPEALDHYIPNELGLSINTVALRVTVEIPTTTTTSGQTHILSQLLEATNEHVPLVAVLLEDLPIPPVLERAVNASAAAGQTILVPAGVLPEAVWDWNPEDKLTTIKGLAGHPQVITITSATPETGVDEWTRRGPTPSLLPKPDLAAPSPIGTTVGAVANVLPYAESMVLRGLHDVHLARAVLGGLAVDTTTEQGTPATYWEQGYGLLDLGAFLELPTIDVLIQHHADQIAENVTTATKDLATTLDTTTETIETADPNEIAGAALGPIVSIRTGVAHTLVQLTVDPPAVPHTLLADFGTVNHERKGEAYFGAIDVGPLVNASKNAIFELIQQAGYTGTELDNITENVTELLRIRAETGQEVTLNATHYHLPDLLENDLLYTGYRTLLEHIDPELDNADPNSSIGLLRDRLDDWTIDPYHLAEENNGKLGFEVTVDRNCNNIPVGDILELLDSVLAILNHEADVLARSTNNAISGPVTADIPANTEDLLSSGALGFVRGQAQKLVCAGDLRLLLSELADRAGDLRELKQIPQGAWNQTEAINGTWDLTPLGAEINATYNLTNKIYQSQAKNATLVLEVTISALEHAIALIDQKLDLLALPSTTTGDPTGPLTLFTIPEETAVAPLGPYMGIATQTSHDVDIYDPLTGDKIASRDITVPFPTFLFNNPTLEWRTQYRDTTPVPGSLVLLHDQQANLFESFSVDVIDESQEVPVNLSAPVTAVFEEHNETLQWRLDQLAVLRDLVNETPGLSPVSDRVNETLDAYEEELVNLLPVSGPIDDPAGLWSLAIGNTLMKLYSRPTFQASVTDVDGEAIMPQLFPGSYSHYEPYPYPKLANLSMDYAPANPGRGDLKAPLDGLPWQTHEISHEAMLALAEHPTARDDDEDGEPGYPSAIQPPEGTHIGTIGQDSYPITEIHGDGVGPFHQFGFDLVGPDLLTVACVDLIRFSGDTNTPVNAPGCTSPVLPGLDAFVHELLVFSQCVLGATETPAQVLDPDQLEQCIALAAQFREAEERCAAADDCNPEEILSHLREAVDDLADLALQLAGLHGSPEWLPLLRSPARVLSQDQDAFGYGRQDLIDHTVDYLDNQDINHTLEEVETSVDAILAELDVRLANAADLVEPPRVDRHPFTVAQGILGHVTDKVVGGDWFHWTTRTNLTVTANPDDPPVVREIDRLADMVDEFDVKPDHDLLRALADRVELDLSDQGVGAFNEGLDMNLSQALGTYYQNGTVWQPNGTVVDGGYRLDAPGETQALDEDATCEEASLGSGVPSSYLPCSALSSETAPTVHGLAHIDRLQAADILLQEARAHEEAIHDGSVDASVLEAILTQTAALSTTDNRSEVTRVTGGIQVDQRNEKGNLTADPVPLIGAMHYQLPIPVNEHVQLRFQSEMLLENSMGLLMISPDATITHAVLAAVEGLEAVETISGANATDPDSISPGLDSVQAAVGHLSQAVAGVLDSEASDLLRVELVGFPIGVEEHLEAPLVPTNTGGSSVGRAGDPCAKPGTQGMQLCARGMAVAQPTGFHNLSRTYEFNTKGGAGGNGVPHLNILFVYLPRVLPDAQPTGPDANETDPENPLTQRVGLRNTTLQASTYLGKATSDKETAAPYNMGVPLRYRPNVEDWNLLWAVPAQPPGDPTEGTGLEFSFGSFPTQEDGPLEDHLIRGLTSSDLARCPDTNAPGYPTKSFASTPRGFSTEGGGNGIYQAPNIACDRNTIYGLAPHHVEAGEKPYSRMKEPEKKLTDALAYQFNVLPIEEFTTRGTKVLAEDRLNPLNDPLASGLLAGPHVVNDAQTIANTATGGALDELALAGAITDGRIPVLGDAVSTALNGLPRAMAVPATTPGFAKSYTGHRAEGTGGDPTGLPPATHNYVWINESVAFRMLNASADPWNPELVVEASDNSSEQLAGIGYTPDAYAIETQVLGIGPENKHHGIVTAHSALVRAYAPTEKETDDEEDISSGRDSTETILERQVQVLAGHGTMGEGVALRLVHEQLTQLEEVNEERVLAGFEVADTHQMRVEIYLLGGLRTGGSTCSMVPLYQYVQDYFRCVGYDGVMTKALVGAGASVSDCDTHAYDLLEASQGYLQGTVVDATTRPWFDGDRLANDAIAWLEGTDLTDPESTSPPPGPEAANRVEGYAEDLEIVAGLVQDLLGCVQPSGDRTDIAAASTGVVPGALDALTHLGQDVLDRAKNISLPRFLDGEPDRNLVARPAIAGAEGGFLGAGDPEEFESASRIADVTVGLDEWSTLLDQAVTTTSATHPNGSTDSSTLGKIHGPLTGQLNEARFEYQSDQGRLALADLRIENETSGEIIASHDGILYSEGPGIMNFTTFPGVNTTTPVNVSYKYCRDSSSFQHATVRTVLDGQTVDDHSFQTPFRGGDSSSVYRCDPANASTFASRAFTIEEPGLTPTHETRYRTELLHGSDYNVSVRTVDAQSQVATTDLEFTVDLHRPQATAYLAPDILIPEGGWQYAPASLNVSWRVVDNDTGLARFDVDLIPMDQGPDTECQGYHNETTLATPTQPGKAIWINRTVPLEGCLTGESLTARLTMWDRAGNQAETIHHIGVDLEAPLLDGLVNNINETIELAPGELPWVTTPQLNLNATAQDEGPSGLASVTVRVNETDSDGQPVGTGTVMLTESSLGGNATLAWEGILADDIEHDTSYGLFVEASDRAANANTSLVAEVQVQVFPTLDPTFPEYLWQAVGNGSVPVNATVSVPELPGVDVDQAGVTVISMKNGSQVFGDVMGVNVTGTVATAWNASTANPGSYEVLTWATLGQANSSVLATVDVTAPHDGARNLTEWRTYDTVFGHQRAQVWRINYERVCVGEEGKFRVILDDPGLALHVTQGDPGQVGSDPADYTEDRTGTEPDKKVTWTGALPGDVFSVMIHQQGTWTETDHRLTFYTWCSDGEPPVEPEQPEIQH